MRPSYRRITAQLVVRAEASSQVERELSEAVDLIASDNIVYTYSVATKRTARPANADDYEMDESE